MLMTAWYLKDYAKEGIDIYKKYQEQNSKIYDNSEDKANYLNTTFKTDRITILGFANGGVKTDKPTDMKKYFFVLDKKTKTLVYYELINQEELTWENDKTVPSELSDKPLTVDNAKNLISQKKDANEKKLNELNKKIKYLGVIELVKKDKKSKKSKFLKEETKITITVQADGHFYKKDVIYELEPISKTVDDWEKTIQKTVPELFQSGGRKSRKSRKSRKVKKSRRVNRKTRRKVSKKSKRRGRKSRKFSKK